MAAKIKEGDPRCGEFVGGDPDRPCARRPGHSSRFGHTDAAKFREENSRRYGRREERGIPKLTVTERAILLWLAGDDPELAGVFAREAGRRTARPKSTAEIRADYAIRKAVAA